MKMEVKKVVLWSDYESKYLINEEEIVERYNSGEDCLIITGVSAKAEELQEKYKKSDLKFATDDELEEFLREEGYEQAEVYYADRYQEKDKDYLVFDRVNEQFCMLSDYPTIRIKEWWDGSNIKIIALEEHMTETKLIISEDYVDLDEWDGRNHVTGGIGNHQRIYKIYEMDGEKVEDHYLVEYWSQWQGVHDTAEILDLEGVKAHLEQLGRNVKEYMDSIIDLK